MSLSNYGKYHLWAGEKIRALLKDLSDEELNQNLGEEFSFPSIRSHCEHILVTLDYCFEFLKGEPRKKWQEVVAENQKLSNQALFKKWAEKDQKLAAALQGENSDEVSLPFFGEEPVIITQADYYLHCVSHTIYHRGQIIIALKKLGKAVVGTDYLFYFGD